MYMQINKYIRISNRDNYIKKHLTPAKNKMAYSFNKKV